MRRIILLLTMLVLFGTGIECFWPDSAANAQVPAPAPSAAQSLGGTSSATLAAAWHNLGSQRQPTAVILVLALGVVTILLFWVGSYSDMLRDETPYDFGGASGASDKPLRRPFSMAQCQMAWWFILVFLSYLYLFLVTGEINTLSGQALMLMGIGTGTAIGAAMVEQSKSPTPTLQTFNTIVQQLEAAQKMVPPVPTDITALEKQRDALASELASTNIFDDILTDVNGISLHRFQSFIWTIALGFVFLIEVVIGKKMPQFDAYTLGVLGISAGTYLGFKIPEQPN